MELCKELGDLRGEDRARLAHEEARRSTGTAAAERCRLVGEFMNALRTGEAAMPRLDE